MIYTGLYIYPLIPPQAEIRTDGSRPFVERK
jgi:hypothetical protein